MFESVLHNPKIIIKIIGIKIVFKNPFALLSNKILVVDKNGKERRVFRIKGINVTFRGTNSTIKYYKLNDKHNKSMDINIRIDSNSSLILYQPHSSYRCSINAFCQDNTHVQIGKNLASGGVNLTFCNGSAGTKITIGDNCLFSEGVYIFAGDGHKIFMKDDPEQKAINHSRDIFIGNHVWVGKDTVILKGAKISDNSIIGTKSVVTKQFDEDNIVIAGNPAKKVKDGVDWTYNF